MVPIIFVIIVTYKGKDWYDRCFTSLRESIIPIQTIVVDNASNDFDVAIPEKYKVDDGETAEQIESRIADMLERYEVQIVDFQPFKRKVECLEEKFIKQLKNCLNRYNIIVNK